MQSILQACQAEIEIKHSRFICYLYPITSEEEARQYIQQQRKEEWKARHHCSAFIINEHLQRSNDDGEPAGTAGLPILEALKQAEVEGVLAVVVRYFGGIKLGKGGLIRAYSQVTKAALAKAQFIRYEKQTKVHLRYAYKWIDSLQYYIEQQQLVSEETSYGSEVEQTIYVPNITLEEVRRHLLEKFSQQIQLTVLDTKEVAVPVPNPFQNQ